jgi:hypothetical protein
MEQGMLEGQAAYAADLLIGYDRRRAAEHALPEATGPPAHRRALVLGAREAADGGGAHRS